MPNVASGTPGTGQALPAPGVDLDPPLLLEAERPFLARLKEPGYPPRRPESSSPLGGAYFPGFERLIRAMVHSANSGSYPWSCSQYRDCLVRSPRNPREVRPRPRKAYPAGRANSPSVTDDC